MFMIVLRSFIRYVYFHSGQSCDNYRKSNGGHTKTHSHFSTEQVEALDGYFQTEHYPQLDLRMEIAEKIDLHQNQVGFINVSLSLLIYR